MEEKGGSLTNGTTKRRLKICLRSGQEAHNSESLGGVLSEQTKPSAEGDLSRDVEDGILDLRPTSQQGKEWNLRKRKDQLDILWLIRKKCPRLVIGCGECILFCTVLYHEQIRRGAWFLHNLSATHRSSLFRA